MYIEREATELLENRSRGMEIIKLQTTICMCEDCGDEFESDNISTAYCDACWYHHETHIDESEKECECLWGCDYCLGVESRIGRN